LSVLELVGQVPDAYLHGMILSYDDGVGIVVYESGTRVGNRVVVNTTLYPRVSRPAGGPSNLLTSFGCLGQTPHFDHMGSTVPASTLHVYDRYGVDVTSRIEHMFITREGTLQPLANSRQAWRYPEDVYGPGQTPVPRGPEGLRIPPNMGCRIGLGGADLYPLTGVFTFELGPSVRAYVLGAQQAKFKSYIGPGSVGIFQPLMNQMSGTFGWRHTRIPLSVPDGADYFLVKFPATPGDPYTDSRSAPPYMNAERPSSGTYRLSRGGLSADLTFSAAFPLEIAWQDADQAPGSEYLPLMRDSTELATLEYVLPAGIAYNDCFTQGNCPSSVLQEIYDAEMTLEIIYLKILQPGAGGQWVPLQMAGPAWSAAAAASSQAPDSSEQPGLVSDALEQIPHAPSARTYTFMPLVSWEPQEEAPCASPCGWFDDLGRMLDYAAGGAGTH
jgi:hypothetical protein